VVVDGNMVFAGGVTAGIDGALRIATDLRGEEVAQGIQLYMQYAPKPPFNAGVPETPPGASRRRGGWRNVWRCRNKNAKWTGTVG
jgi:cyclohexyl-isocyanide hydratase